MTLSKLVAIALAVITLTAGAGAAMPGNAPDHAGSTTAEQAADHGHHDQAEGNETGVDGDEPAEDGDADGAGQQRNASQEQHGPPVDLPSQVPDHVAQIHDLIRQFLNEDLDGSLGKAISGVMGGGQAANGGNGNADAAQRG